MTTTDHYAASRLLLAESREQLIQGHLERASTSFWRAAARSFRATAEFRSDPNQGDAVAIHDVGPIIIDAADNEPDVPLWVATAIFQEELAHQQLPPLELERRITRLEQFVARLDGIVRLPTWNEAILVAYRTLPPNTAVTAQDVARIIAQGQPVAEDPASSLAKGSIQRLRSAHSAFAARDFRLASHYGAEAGYQMVKAVAEQQKYHHNDPSQVDWNLHRLAVENDDMELFDLYATVQALADDVEGDTSEPDVLTAKLNHVAALLIKLTDLIGYPFTAQQRPIDADREGE